MMDVEQIRKAFGPLSEQEALDVMEGRQPAADEPEVEAAAAAIFEGLLDDPELELEPEDRVPPSGSAQALPAQPWMKMAASLLIGVLLSGIVGSQLPTDSGAPEYGATTDVITLTRLRSGGVDELDTIARPAAGTTVSLIAYPAFIDADEVQIALLRQQPSPAGDPPPQEPRWSSVFEQTMGPGTRDSVVVVVASEVLVPGIYKLRIESIRDGNTTAAEDLPFRVDR